MSTSLLKEIFKSVSYGFLDILTGGKGLERTINGTSVRFPVRYSRYYESDYEPVTFEFLRRNCVAGGTFLDCGGHIGLFAVVSAKLVGKNGRVFSFEPTPHTREILRNVVSINGCEDIVEVRAEAITDKSGVATFFETADDVSNANSLVQTERHSEGTIVPTVSIDKFVAERGIAVSAIKIDVEGAELNALRGAYQTLKTQRPPLSLGLHPPAMTKVGPTLKEVWSILEQLKYVVYFEGKRAEQSWFVKQENLFDVQCYSQD